VCVWFVCGLCVVCVFERVVVSTALAVYKRRPATAVFLDEIARRIAGGLF